MKRQRRGFYWLLTLVVFLTLTSACGYVQQREVRRGLEASMARLPQQSSFEVVGSLYEEFSDRRCYYAGVYLVIGSPLEERAALDLYVRELQSLGWVLFERQFETEKGLTYDEHSWLTVDTGPPGPLLDSVVDYEQLKQTYRSILVVRVVFMVPSRDEC